MSGWGSVLKGVGKYMLALGLVQTWPYGQMLVIFCVGSRVLKKRDWVPCVTFSFLYIHLKKHVFHTTIDRRFAHIN